MPATYLNHKAIKEGRKRPTVKILCCDRYTLDFNKFRAVDADCFAVFSAPSLSDSSVHCEQKCYECGVTQVKIVVEFRALVAPYDWSNSVADDSDLKEEITISQESLCDKCILSRHAVVCKPLHVCQPVHKILQENLDKTICPACFEVFEGYRLVR